MREERLAVELLETRHVRDAFKAMPVKTDRKDARGIAHLMRLGWFRPVHCKSLPAQETRTLLTARKLVQSKHHDTEMSLRGILRGFGLKTAAIDRQGRKADGNYWPEAERQRRSERSRKPAVGRAFLSVQPVSTQSGSSSGRERVVG
jgi:hypothetical protein